MPQCSARTLFHVLIIVNDGASTSFLDRMLPFYLVLRRVYYILLVCDCQNFFPVKPYLHKRPVRFRKPEAIYLLILPHKVGPLDPERWSFCRMPLDPNHSIIANINPQVAFKQIFVFP